MNLTSHISHYLSYLSIPSLTSCFYSYWAGRKVDQMVRLPECTYTSLSLKALESEDYTALSARTIWDKAKSSSNINIYEDDPTKLERNNPGKGIDTAMSDTGFSKGIHILDIEWPTGMRGTHPVIGVALEGSPNQGIGYRNLLGGTESSWGWDIKSKELLHNGQIIGNYPEDKSNGSFDVPEKISCIIDMNAGVIGFKIGGKYLGDAFSGLKHKTVFLAVSVVRTSTTISVNYIKGSNTTLSLQDLSKLAIRKRVKFEEQIAQLPTAPPLKRFIADQEMTDGDGNDDNTDQENI